MALPGLDSVQGQPVRTITNGDVVSAICDGTTVSQKLGVDSAGRITIKLDDGSGNAITSQINGSQRALDIGINVAGIQIDPRSVGQYNSTLPTVTSGSNTPLQTNANGVLYVAQDPDLFPATGSITTQDTGSTSAAEFNQTWYQGTPTAGSFFSYVLSSNETVMIEISGTWTGTLQSEISVDGINWIAHSIHIIGSSIFTASFTANVVGSLNVAAKTNVRVRATAAMTGSATIKFIASQNASSVYVANSIKLVDGSSATSSTAMNIVAASTAASATNTAIVVGLSPNSPLPAGQTGVIGAVNQGTSPWIVKDQSDGPVAPGTAASFSMLTGGVYNSAGVTLSNGQQSAIQLNSAGALIIRPLSASTDTVVSNQGTAGTASQGWFTKITDGTNTVGVTPASTAAIATQPAAVVAFSPNSPLPSGQTGVIGAVNQGTSPWVTSDLADGPVIPGTAASKSLLGGAVYNSTPPVLTNGQQAALQVNASGALLVSVSSVTPGTPINNYYTSPSAVAYGSSDTHLYTITSGKTLNAKKFFASAPGRIRIDVQLSTNGSTFSTVFTAYNSTATPVVSIDMDEFYVPDSGSGAAVQIVRYNEEPGSSFGISSTISGSEN